MKRAQERNHATKAIAKFAAYCKIITIYTGDTALANCPLFSKCFDEVYLLAAGFHAR